MSVLRQGEGQATGSRRLHKRSHMSCSVAVGALARQVAKLSQPTCRSLALLLTCPLHPRRRSEDCTFVVDAFAGCGGRTPCSVRITLSGETEQDWDFVSVWRVPDRANPTAALRDASNRVANLSGTLRYDQTVSTSTGMVLIRFTSDEEVNAAGWTATWSASAAPPPSPSPPPSGGFCVSRTVVGGSGTITDGSGSSDYRNG